MASKTPKPVRGVKYGATGLGPYADEVSAVGKRQEARDAAIRRRTPVKISPPPEASLVESAVKEFANKRTAKARARGARDLAVSKSVANMGRRLVDERYGVDTGLRREKPIAPEAPLRTTRKKK